MFALQMLNQSRLLIIQGDSLTVINEHIEKGFEMQSLHVSSSWPSFYPKKKHRSEPEFVGSVTPKSQMDRSLYRSLDEVVVRRCQC